MYNFGYNSVLPFTAAVNGSDRLVNALIGIIIIPLFILAGFSAIESDFENIMPMNSGGPGYISQSNKPSICNMGQRQSSSLSGGSVIGNILGKGMILCPLMPGDQFVNFSSKKDCGKANGTICDSTIYLLTDMVDKPPELIWMIYPDLSNVGLGSVSSVQITLNILVDYTGKPLEVTIADETLIGHSAKQIVLESARTSVFKPARKNNQSVRCWVQIRLALDV